MGDFVSFDEFLQRTERARRAHDMPEESVVEPAEFEKMRAHVLSLYRGVKAVHSYVDADGQIFDCVPADQQPGLRRPDGTFAKLAAPPAAPPTPGADRVPANAAPPPEAQREADEFGNRRECPSGCVPIRRVTLEALSRFGTLEDYFRKPPPSTTLAPPPSTYIHRHASGEQVVDNFGGSSVLNLWAPNPAPGYFSLSQIWCTAGPTIIGDPNLQTVEVGWQVSPAMYGHSKPVLFVYWTSDGYGPSGGYNLDKPGFVLNPTPPVWSLGGAFGSWSTTGGAQFEVIVQWMRDLVYGNWWLYVGYPPGPTSPVGYYPRALFGSGPMSSHAQRIRYGGEVATADGGFNTGQMGSGALAASGYGFAAYQRSAIYYSLVGTATSATISSEGYPVCYTFDLHNNTPDPTWGTYFFFGGPKCPP